MVLAPEPVLASPEQDRVHAESGQLAERLKEKGFTKVTVLDEGLGYWRSKNYGVEHADPPSAPPPAPPSR